MKAIQFARKYTKKLTKENVHIILNARKALLFNNSEAWVKRENSDFDVTMGAFD